MQSYATKLVAYYGALVATFTVGWNVYRDVHDRARVKLSAMVGHAIKNGIIARTFAVEEFPEQFLNLAPEIFVTITNIGRRPVIVQGWAIRVDRKKTGKDNFIYALKNLPRALKEGEFVIEHTADLSLLIEGATRIYAWDTTGKKWFLTRRDFRKLQREARRGNAPTTREEPI